MMIPVRLRLQRMVLLCMWLCVSVISKEVRYNEGMYRGCSNNKPDRIPIMSVQQVYSIRNFEMKMEVNGLSPTQVFRAVMAHLRLGNMTGITIVTEKRFEIIVRQWEPILLEYDRHCGIHVLHENITAYKLTMATYSMFARIKSTVIIVLTPKFLEDFFSYIKKQEHSEEASAIFELNRKLVIIGCCLPSFFGHQNFPLGINMNLILARVNLNYWLQGKHQKGTLKLYSVQRDSRKKFTAFPITTELNDSRAIISRREYFKYLNGRPIFLNYYSILGNIQYKKKSLFGFSWDLTRALQEFLGFRISPDVQSLIKTLRRPSQWNPGYSDYDIEAGIFLSDQLDRIAKWKPFPHFFRDRLAIFALKRTQEISIKELVRILDTKVWISVLIAIFCINFCMLIVYYKSEILRRTLASRRIDPMSKAVNCVFCGGLSLLETLQRVPNLPTKWLLLSFSVLYFFMSTIYLTLYATKILSLGQYLPFDTMEEIIENRVLVYMSYQSTVASAGLATTGDFRRYKPKLALASLFNLFEALDIEEGAILEMQLAGSHYLKFFPHVGECRLKLPSMDSSWLTREDFVFHNIFSHIFVRMRETGTIQALKIRYYTPPAHISVVSIKPIEVHMIWFLFPLTAIGVIMSLLAAIFENIYHYCH